MANRLLEQVTKGGAIDLVSPALNDQKLIAADKILQGIRMGESAAVTAFRSHLGAKRVGEAIHTTGDDFIFAFGQLLAFEVVNEWEAAVRTWDQAIGVEEVSTFEAPKSYSINPVVDGYARPQTEPNKPAHIVPIVPEGSPYPHFIFSGDTAAANGIAKAGGEYGLTFEKIVNDVAGIVPLIPRLITESLLEREEYDAWQGLVDFIDVPDNHLDAGVTLDGVAVPADAPISQASLALALRQAREREVIPGRRVSVSSYTLIVPTGTSDVANYYLNQVVPTGFSTTTAGTPSVTRDNTFSGFNPLSGITSVVETDYLTGSQWALIPAKGAIRGTRKFYNYGRLRGNVGPELRVENATGLYLGGGSVAPFEGSFKTDTAAIRGRIIGGGLGWENAYAVISDGDGTP